MNYRTFFLSIVMLPVLISAQSTKETIQELKEQCLKKRFELSRLGQEIAERERYMRIAEDEVYNNIIIKALIDKDKKEQEALAKSIALENTTFLSDLVTMLHQKESVKDFLNQKLFDQHHKLDAVKFFIVRYVTEHTLLKKLIDQYAALMQEITNLEDKIAELQMIF